MSDDITKRDSASSAPAFDSDCWSDEAQAQFDAWRDAGARPQEAPSGIQELEAVGEWTRASIELQVQSVPDAQFEALWERIAEVTASQPASVSQPANTEASWWERTAAWVWRYLAGPRAFAVAGAAALAVAWISFAPRASEPGAAVSPQYRQSPLGSAPVADASSPSTVGDSSQLAVAPEPDDQQTAEPGVESTRIERIDFAGASGRISQIENQRGTTTVIWIDEEDLDAKKPATKAMDL